MSRKQKSPPEKEIGLHHSEENELYIIYVSEPMSSTISIGISEPIALCRLLVELFIKFVIYVNVLYNRTSFFKSRVLHRNCEYSIGIVKIRSWSAIQFARVQSRMSNLFRSNREQTKSYILTDKSFIYHVVFIRWTLLVLFAIAFLEFETK